MRRDATTAAVIAILWVCAVVSGGDEPPAWTRTTGLRPFSYGVTRNDTPLVAWQHPDALSPLGKRRVLLIGGTAGAGARDAVERAAVWFYSAEEAADLRKTLVLSIIPDMFPDGGDAADRPRFEMPRDGFYDARESPENRYLWRFLGISAPDFVLEMVAAGDAAEPLVGPLTAALERAAPGNVGTIPAKLLPGSAAAAEEWAALARELRSLPETPSAARVELQRRLKRTPAEIAAELSAVYGRELKDVAYIPALALVAKQRLKQAAEVARILAPFETGDREPTPKSGSDQAGHLLFRELALSTEGAARERWIELVRVAADQMFDSQGRPRDVMPFHNEMSDAVFMSGPILAAAGRLTGEERYAAACLTHLRAMRKFCLREDGLYRHSPLCEAAWGRGNGFPTLGLAMVIEDLPRDDARRSEVIGWQRAHLQSLSKHQDATGCFHQVIDKPESYREFTATAMIAYAVFRGVDQGYLPRAEFEPVGLRAWEAIKQRIGPQGLLFDVCTGTGKQKTLRDYYDRPAILGVDARGGALGLLLTAEMVNRER